MSVNKFGVELDRALEAFRRSVQITCGAESGAKIGMSFRIFRILFHRPADKIDRNLMIPALVMNDSKKMQSFSLLRDALENLLIGRRRQSQIAGLM